MKDVGRDTRKALLITQVKGQMLAVRKVTRAAVNCVSSTLHVGVLNSLMVIMVNQVDQLSHLS